ncbi:DUF481 domain-containing protein [Gimesia maris]|uniref:DUF481 domain-containing protein n=1 Tax=Gimesia maris TaxID=122 RepID=A0ABX5YQA1_9PLAN|nr:DUF481 domain-containing protein [Gimesia maris]QEG17803.1 hypothetical protein GmarT_36860 [Gimesia maris]QGQ29158.1 DUF481 domain-containing protein [Gimesia maris]
MGCSTPFIQSENRLRFLLIHLVCLWGLTGIVYSAEDSEVETLYLKSGEYFSGESIGFEDGNILFRLPDGQVHSILLENVDRLEYQEAGTQSGKDDQLLISNDNAELPPLPSMINQVPVPEPLGVAPDLDEGVDEESAFGQITEYSDQCWEYVEIWTKRFELGGSYLAGNTDRSYVTTGLNLEKSDNNNLFEFEIGGRWGQSNGVRDANRWYGNATLDIARSTNWIVFFTNKNTYDEFENLDWRGTISSGLGYRFINEDDRRLIVRIGPGGTREIYNSPTLKRTTFDIFAELEFKYPLSDHIKLEHKQTWTPSVDIARILRVTTETGLLFKLDNQDRWNLRVGLLQIYNSFPNAGRKKSDYTGSVSLVYTRK